jgi:hypothetical protein
LFIIDALFPLPEAAQKYTDFFDPHPGVIARAMPCFKSA